MSETPKTITYNPGYNVVYPGADPTRGQVYSRVDPRPVANAMPDPAAAYRAGFVRRHHQNPELAPFGQTDAAHTWGVVTLLFAFHPNPTIELIRAAQMHDVGEYVVGDLNALFKIANPDIANRHRILEKAARIGIVGRDYETVTNRDQQWLKFCDVLEAFCFVLLSAPAHTACDGWPETLQHLRREARELGVYDPLTRFLNGISPHWKTLT